MRVIKEFSTKSDGTFAIDVPPGDYGIRLATPSMFPNCSSEMIHVTINSTTVANVSCDTGIR